MKKDYFGLYDPNQPGPHGLQLAADRSGMRRRKLIYGVHGNSGYLFRFDPRRAAHRSAGSPHLRAVQTQRHVRPVQLRLSRLRARAGRADDLLPDRRPDLRRRQTRHRQGHHRARAKPRGWRICTWSPATSPPASTPITARSSTRTATARSTSTPSPSAKTARSIPSAASPKAAKPARPLQRAQPTETRLTGGPFISAA